MLHSVIIRCPRCDKFTFVMGRELVIHPAKITAPCKHCKTDVLVLAA